MCYRAACLPGALVVVVVVAVVVSQLTINCSESQRVELRLRSPEVRNSVLKFASCICFLSGHVVSMGNLEKEYTGWEVIGSG